MIAIQEVSNHLEIIKWQDRFEDCSKIKDGDTDSLLRGAENKVGLSRKTLAEHFGVIFAYVYQENLRERFKEELNPNEIADALDTYPDIIEQELDVLVETGWLKSQIVYEAKKAKNGLAKYSY